MLAGVRAQALLAAGLGEGSAEVKDIDATRAGILIGTAMGGMETFANAITTLHQQARAPPAPLPPPCRAARVQPHPRGRTAAGGAANASAPATLGGRRVRHRLWAPCRKRALSTAGRVPPPAAANKQLSSANLVADLHWALGRSGSWQQTEPRSLTVIPAPGDDVVMRRTTLLPLQPPAVTTAACSSLVVCSSLRKPLQRKPRSRRP